MFETTKEAMRPYNVKTDDWCMFVGYTNSEDDRQSFRTVTQEENEMIIYGHAGCSDMRD